MKYKIPAISPNKPIVVYSNIGIRAEEVVSYAIQKGFKDIKSLYGGARLWNKMHSI